MGKRKVYQFVCDNCSERVLREKTTPGEWIILLVPDASNSHNIPEVYLCETCKNEVTADQVDIIARNKS